MVLDSLKGVAVLKSVRLMWQSTISIAKNFLPLGRLCAGGLRLKSTVQKVLGKRTGY